MLTLAAMGVSVLANDNFSRALEPSNLLLSISGSDTGLFPMSIDANAVSVLTYDLAEGSIAYTVGHALSTTYEDPIFCFDFGEPTAGALRVNATDVNGHVVIDRLPLASSLAYSLDLEMVSMQAPGSAQCFYKGGAGQFGLFGVAPENNSANNDGNGDEGVLFGDKFEAHMQLEVEFLDLPQWASPFETVEYKIAVTNVGDADFERVAFQELLPANSLVFNAWFADSDLSCAGSGNNPDSGSASCGGSWTSNGVSLRAGHLVVPKGETVTFTAKRFIPSSVSIGGEIHLYAAAGARSGTMSIFDTAEHVITIVGAGESLTATASGAVADDEDEAEIVVTALDADQNPVPGVDITVVEDDGLTILPTQATTDASTGEARFFATTTVADDYFVTFDAEGMDPVEVTISFSAGAPDDADAKTTVDNAVADGSDAVEFTVTVKDKYENPVQARLVTVSDDGGLSSLAGADAYTDSHGLAVFQATSTTATDYTVEFAVDGWPEVTDETEASFVAGAPAGFTFEQEPTDTLLGDVIAPPVIVRVVDANGNWVEVDNSTTIEVERRQQGQPGGHFLEFMDVENGEAIFPALVMDTAGKNFFLRAVDSDGSLSSADSTTFDVDSGPDSLSVTLNNFQNDYPWGAVADDEQVSFAYTENSGDIEQIFNVLRVFDDTGAEIDGQVLFAMLDFGPEGYEDYILGFDTASEPDVVSPQTVDVSVEFEIQLEVAPGDYELVVESYDVSELAPSAVSLADAIAGEYGQPIDSDSRTVEIFVP